MPDRHSLDPLLRPHSVAIVGASSDQRRFGGRPIQYLKEAGFSGEIYPVNPKRNEIQGIPCVGSISDLPDGVDCAIIALGPDATLGAIEECARKGVKSAVLFGAGFAELGEEGEQLQASVVETARQAGIRLLGPNCMGLMNAHHRFYGTFASALEQGVPKPGSIGLVSQSGGYGGYVMKHLLMRGLSFASWVTTGNECDVDAGEVMLWMAQQNEVEVIVAYLEGTRDGKTLIKALELAKRNGKPVVATKVGRSSQGQAAAASHTASLAGEDAVYEAIFAKYGVHRADTSDELLDIAYALAHHREPVGRNIGVMSISGGVGVQLADYLDDEGLTLAATPESTKKRLRSLVPACSPNNPIDMTGLISTNHQIMEDALDAALSSGAFDAMIVFTGIAGMAPSMAAPLREAIIRAYSRHPDKLLIVSTTTTEDELRAFKQAGCLVFEDPSRAATALGALARRGERRLMSLPAATDFTKMPKFDSRVGTVDESQAKEFLTKAGIAFPREILVSSPEEAGAAAESIGAPAAIKVVSPDIAHKTEVGGVALGVIGKEQAATAVKRMAETLSLAAPDARISGFLVAEMVEDGIETIIGVHRDPTFGPIVTFGLGGVMVELIGDVVSRPAPLSLHDAREMIGSIKCAPLLTGFRGSQPLATEKLAECMVRVSELAAANADRIAAIELNPVKVSEDKVVALDALIELR